MRSDALHTLYRPLEWEHVVGQDGIVHSLQNVIERRSSQTFLFCGPAGVGKTTLARLTAAKLGCGANLTETNGAEQTSIDDMRNIIDMLNYKPFGDSSTRGIIIDECHRLSKQAWDCLLKITEEPPPDVYWFFCTTESAKVPATIFSRATAFTLKHLNRNELSQLLDEICALEQIRLPPAIADLVLTQAEGSPRQLLVNLAMCRDLANPQEARNVLQAAGSHPEVVELCRFLCNGGAGGSWSKVASMVNKFKDEDAEGIRIVMQHYLAKAALGAKSDEKAVFFLEMMEQFAVPYNSSEGIAPLLRSVGRVMFAAK
jgi:DNA polymerase III gamma/tau subunit